MRSISVFPVLFLAVLFFTAVFATGCQPKIGGACSSSVECDLSGNRTCDTASPGGYCTIADCTRGSCPSDSVCVRFYARDDLMDVTDAPYVPGRLARSYCMQTCAGDSQCRSGYGCVGQGSPELTGLSVTALDAIPSRRFCAAVRVSMPVLPADAGQDVASDF